MKIFSGNANPALAKDIAAYLGINLGRVKVRGAGEEGVREPFCLHAPCCGLCTALSGCPCDGLCSAGCHVSRTHRKEAGVLVALLHGP